tara:strand:+ start:1534 stop:2307 length:774 start_codon:yes stop_codon:yes gene_type:complete
MIKLLNGELWEEEAILKKMVDDSFYYGHLGKHALSSSAAKKLIDSPKAYQKSLYFSSDSQPLRDGRLTHLAVLEPHRLNDLVIVDGTKAVKAFKEATAEHGSEMVYTKSEMESAHWIAKAVKDCNEAYGLLQGCTFEKPAIKMINGLPFRGKADAIKGRTIIDLKTSSGGLEKFKWSAKNFSYDLQTALYLSLFDADEFIFLVVDKDTKDIGIFECSADFIEIGREKVRKAMNVYKHFYIDSDPLESVRNYVFKDVL